MNPIHFTNNGYTYVKNTTGQYLYRGTDRESLENHAKELRASIEKKQRSLAALESYLSGEAKQDVKALNFRS